MTREENLRILINDWENYYQLDDDLPEKLKAARNLVTFYDSLSHIDLIKKDYESIMNARFYLEFH